MTKTVQNVNKFFSATGPDWADGDNYDVDPADSKFNAIEIHNIIHGGSCDVKILQDTDGDGTYEVNVTIDSLTGAGISQGNSIELGEDDRMLLRITNTSGSAADFMVTGVELSQ